MFFKVNIILEVEDGQRASNTSLAKVKLNAIYHTFNPYALLMYKLQME